MGKQATATKENTAIGQGWHRYSEPIAGDQRNHGWGVRVDVSADGYVGINQIEDGRHTDRVLLTPAQFRAIQVFVRKAVAAMLHEGETHWDW